MAELKKIDLNEQKHADKRCYCEYCKFCGKVRGAMRRGDKKEMRAVMREIMDRYTELGQQHEVLKAFVTDVMKSTMLGEIQEKKADTIQ